MTTSKLKSSRSRAELLFHLFLFAGAFASMCLLVRLLLLRPHMPVLTDKLDYFERCADQYDTIFIGSSRFYHQIDPELFDRALNSHGLPSKSFNFGVDGMFSPEALAICERVLSMKPSGLRRVFIESTGFYRDFGGQDPDSPRAVYTHDNFGALRLYWHLIFNETDSTLEQRDGGKWTSGKVALSKLFLEHVQAHLINLVNLGRGSDLFARLRVCKYDGFPPTLGSSGNGFEPLNATFNESERLQYERECLALQKSAAPRTVLSDAAQARLEAVLTAIRAAGVKPYLIISPMPMDRRFYPADSAAVGVLDFSDVNEWAELYQSKYRMDSVHLNAAGSAIYTHALAEQFIAFEKIFP